MIGGGGRDGGGGGRGVGGDSRIWLVILHRACLTQAVQLVQNADDAKVRRQVRVLDVA